LNLLKIRKMFGTRPKILSKVIYLRKTVWKRKKIPTLGSFRKFENPDRNCGLTIQIYFFDVLKLSRDKSKKVFALRLGRKVTEKCKSGDRCTCYWRNTLGSAGSNISRSKFHKTHKFCKNENFVKFCNLVKTWLWKYEFPNIVKIVCGNTADVRC